MVDMSDKKFIRLDFHLNDFALAQRLYSPTGNFAIMLRTSRHHPPMAHVVNYSPEKTRHPSQPPSKDDDIYGFAKEVRWYEEHYFDPNLRDTSYHSQFDAITVKFVDISTPGHVHHLVKIRYGVPDRRG